MQRFLAKIVMFIGVAALLALPLILPVAAQAANCLSEYDIQSAIEAGRIQSWPKIKRSAGISKSSQEVSDVQVCLRNGVPYYYVNVMSSNGTLSKLVLNAVDGSS